MDDLILTECYVDTNLLETLVPPASGYNHQHGCANVTKIMSEKFALGIIDKDKKAVKYLSEFDTIIEKENIILLKHKKRIHYIIQLKPAIEKWVLNISKELKLNIEDFELPSNEDAFKSKAKSQTSKKDKSFKQLFKEIKNRKAESKTVNTFINWVEHLKENKFNANLDTLKAA